MSLDISFEATGVGLTTFTSSTALAAGVLITAGIGSVANNALSLRIPTTFATAVSAYVTGVTFNQTINGAPIFTAQGQDNSVFAFYSPQSFATPILLQGGGSATSGTIAFQLSATGAECALDAQVASITLSLSSVALSGAGVRIVATPTSTVTVSVTAVNTPNNSGTGEFACDSEVRRLVTLGYI